MYLFGTMSDQEGSNVWLPWRRVSVQAPFLSTFGSPFYDIVFDRLITDAGSMLGQCCVLVGVACTIWASFVRASILHCFHIDIQVVVLFFFALYVSFSWGDIAGTCSSETQFIEQMSSDFVQALGNLYSFWEGVFRPHQKHRSSGIARYAVFVYR